MKKGTESRYGSAYKRVLKVWERNSNSNISKDK